MGRRSGCWKRARSAGCSASRWKCWSAAGTTTCCSLRNNIVNYLPRDRCILLESLPHTMSEPTKKGLFVTDDGQNLMFIFILVSSLFLLWGFCNGMIDVMDKHFQEELGLNKSQSAWVQFAHYLGYFLMSMPAGWLAGKLGYKGGIITGLLIVAAGGFWVIPATHLNAMGHEGRVPPPTAFGAFRGGFSLTPPGLAFRETIRQPPARKA